MASPFPGMDPFLENPAYWLDFHSRFVNCWCEAIADGLPEDYEASLGDRVYLVEHEPEARKLGYPDIAVTHSDGARATASTGGMTATLEPVTVPLEILDGPHEAYIEILHLPERSLVAVLELLSPTNKESPGRALYYAKRTALLYQDVHLVELDLLRSGRRMPMKVPLPPGDCYYFVSRPELRPDCQVFTWSLRQPLPKLPVPLRGDDPDLIFDLASVFTTAYDRGRFRRRISYSAPIIPPLGDDDQRWVESILSQK
jgi:Protein of unknown function (DUF4058)